MGPGEVFGSQGGFEQVVDLRHNPGDRPGGRRQAVDIGIVGALAELPGVALKPGAQLAGQHGLQHGACRAGSPFHCAVERSQGGAQLVVVEVAFEPAAVLDGLDPLWLIVFLPGARLEALHEGVGRAQVAVPDQAVYLLPGFFVIVGERLRLKAGKAEKQDGADGQGKDDTHGDGFQGDGIYSTQFAFGNF